ncbi:hypothetical protein RRU94_15705 [Domibacillus sp. DTU_2020_1001157_1_SI_ALB_TIR_016]|uniref:hypothetical protein n=1 Tax=Domibacillus sp. DTU_2020_1001157_1_SI_ALB_TIR_016 TaxID=3077789 RepID=UPI0028E4105F|nr:hypothetical protein [Domibacillus sp. DTU_2020_1001157_1_SI_ALB_TIR_016]WNS82191.1 hypothetical protein RRU94_15705 [Domibacillus sp. DTU_2020_1001157_1_SI_ALB_TIR_016]
MDIKKIVQAKSLDEMKELGKMLQIKRALQKVCGDHIKIRARSWEELFLVIQKLRELALNEFSKSEISTELIVTKEETDSDLPYFKTKTDEIIYSLIELQGKQRQDKLKITKFCYNNPKYARKWRNNLAKLIHPDKTKHPRAEEAIKVLQELYEGMVE